MTLVSVFGTIVGAFNAKDTATVASKTMAFIIMISVDYLETLCNLWQLQFAANHLACCSWQQASKHTAHRPMLLCASLCVLDNSYWLKVSSKTVLIWDYFFEIQSIIAGFLLQEKCFHRKQSKTVLCFFILRKDNWNFWFSISIGIITSISIPFHNANSDNHYNME